MREEEQKAIVETFQRVMKDVRVELGWTAVQLAAMLNVSRQTISNLETGRQPMSWVQYLALAAITDFATEGKEEQRQRILQIVDQAGVGNMWYTPMAESGSLLLRALTGVVQEATDPSQAALLTNLAEHYKVFLDADIFFADGAPSFFATFSERLRQSGKQAILPYRAVQEMEKQPSETRRRGMAVARNLQLDGCLVIRGESNDPDTHDTIRSVFLKFRSRHKLCLLTQDEAFAHSVLRMNADASRTGYEPIEVYRLENGMLHAYESEDADWSGTKREPLVSWDDLFSDSELKETLADEKVRPAENITLDMEHANYCYALGAEGLEDDVREQNTAPEKQPDAPSSWMKAPSVKPQEPQPMMQGAPAAGAETIKDSKDTTNEDTMSKWFRV